VLDVADRGAHAQQAIANILGVTKTRIYQIEARALDKAKRGMRGL
jgi:DNA-directed RNA polymerase sigma subunit (sigma70/sigma32)